MANLDYKTAKFDAKLMLQLLRNYAQILAQSIHKNTSAQITEREVIGWIHDVVYSNIEFEAKELLRVCKEAKDLQQALESERVLLLERDYK